MIPIVPPTVEVLKDIVLGLIENIYSRYEVKEWIIGMQKEHSIIFPGCMSFGMKNRFAEFVMFALFCINEVGVGKFDSPGEQFIRDVDLEEYLACLNEEDCTERSGNIVRLRPHQIQPVKKVYNTIVGIDCGNGQLLKDIGVFLNRGYFLDLNDYREDALVEYCGSHFVLSYSHNINNNDLYIEGFEGEKEKVAKLLVELNILPNMIKWVNDLIDNEVCRLCRVDDNNNTFVMKTFSSYIEAEIERYSYQKKGHKQTYYLERYYT
ncbi:hypothetical protein [Moorena sp. SIO3B2]|uniref:hypothetical protein n=2 Tax=unclassified Moorena TaxID=2683338 RepID=UPI00257F8009|nr:hypothetical protein [Moorena sp. SIO3B2]